MTDMGDVLTLEIDQTDLVEDTQQNKRPVGNGVQPKSKPAGGKGLEAPRENPNRPITRNLTGPNRQDIMSEPPGKKPAVGTAVNGAESSDKAVNGPLIIWSTPPNGHSRRPMEGIASGEGRSARTLWRSPPPFTPACSAPCSHPVPSSNGAGRSADNPFSRGHRHPGSPCVDEKDAVPLGEEYDEEQGHGFGRKSTGRDWMRKARRSQTLTEEGPYKNPDERQNEEKLVTRAYQVGRRESTLKYSVR
ncbi:Hypothetical predicted protein [Cloeon dipterum]|uniref:Uncharacterized protein n=1 Tax=Cloeon dipterum TaxID=197152 RepID=A0A8S1E4A4_9INSE|nr:Hypothetical predicted protein [Cloeon dipterum]